MRVYLLDEMCFVEIGKGYLLCIGTKEEVQSGKKPVEELVWEAKVHSQFQNITISTGQRVH